MCTNNKIIKNFKGIIDTTLREGHQFLKADFSFGEQKKIFEYLNKIGVDYIELGNPINKELKQTIGTLLKNRLKSNGSPKPKVLVHIRNKKEDLEQALDLDIDGINILCTADKERLKSMNSSLKKHVEELEENIYLAKKNNKEVRVSVEDSFHQSHSNIIKIYKLAKKSYVERIGLADTLGRAMNWEIVKKIKALRKLFKTDIEVHFHNDLGQAVSNSLWALQTGGNWIDTTLLGIGERTGIVALSSLLTSLYVIDPELTKKYNLSIITEAENYVSIICKMEMPFNLITNQINGFAHKAGIHLNALIKHGPAKYELFSPKIIGNQRTLVTNTSISGKTTTIQVEEFYALHGK